LDISALWWLGKNLVWRRKKKQEKDNNKNLCNLHLFVLPCQKYVFFGLEFV